MVLQTERHELLVAWRALAGDSIVDGWRTIPVIHGGPCQLLAGRHFPGNEEALLVGFASARVPPADQLPQGRGFLVSSTSIAKGESEDIWVALRRQREGSLDLFTMVALDIVAVLRRLRGSTDDELLRAFLSRLQAWQEFMRRGEDGVLCPEAEVGLVGELEFLRDLITAGLPATVAVEAWQGPMDGIQDFALGFGAVEVKSTVAPSGFAATIATLEQLDDTVNCPLYLAGMKFALDSSGKTLPEIVNETRHSLATVPLTAALFDNRLLHAGYIDAVAERYTRHFSRQNVRLLPVNDTFPRLTRAKVAIEIRQARYVIDLDLIRSASVDLAYVLKQLGVA